MLNPRVSPEVANPAELDSAERDQFAAELYPELRKLAAAKMRRERSDHTLQPTALVNELWLQLLRNPETTWHDRNHFLAAASQAMHRCLVDHARARKSQKRGGGWQRSANSLDNICDSNDPTKVLAIDELLQRLRRKEPRMASVIEMKFFGGLTFAEIAGVLGVDERTAKRDWTLASAWLRGHIAESGVEDDGGRVGED